MSSVQIFHRDSAGNETLVGVVDGDLIKKHSAEVRNLLATRPPQLVTKVTLHGPSVYGLSEVLKEIKTLEKGRTLEITTKTRDIDEAIDIHRAIHCMKIEPTQTKVEGHLKGYLSHQIVTPAEMVAVHKAYGNPNGPYNKIWKTMIHTIAYKWVGSDMNKTQSDRLKAVAREIPDLNAAIANRVAALEKIKKKQQEMSEKRAAERAAKADNDGWA
jgi:hypothetical protein